MAIFISKRLSCCTQDPAVDQRWELPGRDPHSNLPDDPVAESFVQEKGPVGPGLFRLAGQRVGRGRPRQHRRSRLGTGGQGGQSGLQDRGRRLARHQAGHGGRIPKTRQAVQRPVVEVMHYRILPKSQNSGRIFWKKTQAKSEKLKKFQKTQIFGNYSCYILSTKYYILLV